MEKPKRQDPAQIRFIAEWVSYEKKIRTVFGVFSIVMAIITILLVNPFAEFMRDGLPFILWMAISLYIAFGAAGNSLRLWAYAQRIIKQKAILSIIACIGMAWLYISQFSSSLGKLDFRGVFIIPMSFAVFLYNLWAVIQYYRYSSISEDKE